MAEKLGLPDPTHLRLTCHSVYTSGPQKQALRYRQVGGGLAIDLRMYRFICLLAMSMIMFTCSCPVVSDSDDLRLVSLARTWDCWFR